MKNINAANFKNNPLRVHETNSNLPNIKLITKIAIKSKHSISLLNLRDIDYVMANGSYSLFILKGGEKYLSSEGLYYYEKLLSNSEIFIKVHRSYIVNFNNVTVIRKLKEHIRIEFENANIFIEIGRTHNVNSWITNLTLLT